MLSKTARQRASEIAYRLVNEGMVWGSDLEYFIKSQVYRRKGFKNDEHYFEFEDAVLSFVEERIKKKNVEIVDINTNRRIGLGNMSQLSKILKCAPTTISSCLNKNTLYEGKYDIKYAKLKWNEI
ncbi:hypothetical protein Q3304_20430 [Clostridioides sp. GD02377]|uniref:hypothetical protein n=1 Tax=unclassified Clostridioides TaxID=2635829 RepID=UPI0038AC4E71